MIRPFFPGFTFTASDGLTIRVTEDGMEFHDTDIDDRPGAAGHVWWPILPGEPGWRTYVAEAAEHRKAMR